MTLQALIALLIAFPRRRSETSRDVLESSEMPRWEKNPAEQAYLRDRDRKASLLGTNFPRGY